MRRLFFIAACLAAANAFAQTEIFDPDDFVDPRELAGRALFISRVITGVTTGYTDQYRPPNQTIAFVHFSNTLYWHGLQATYKHTVIKAGSDWSQQNQPQLTSGLRSKIPIPNMPYVPPPIPTPIPIQVSPDAPPPAPKKSLQFAWNHSFGPLAPMLRYRMTWGQLHADLPPGQKNAESGNLYHLEVQTMIRLGGRSIFGDVDVSSVTQRGTVQNSQQRAITYTAHLPLLRIGHALVAPAIAVGHVTGGAAISDVNPSVDLAWSHNPSEINFHVAYSPVVRNAGGGWRGRNQLAFFADRAYAKLFRVR